MAFTIILKSIININFIFFLSMIHLNIKVFIRTSTTSIVVFTLGRASSKRFTIWVFYIFKGHTFWDIITNISTFLNSYFLCNVLVNVCSNIYTTIFKPFILILLSLPSEFLLVAAFIHFRSFYIIIALKPVIYHIFCCLAVTIYRIYLRQHTMCFPITFIIKA